MATGTIDKVMKPCRFNSSQIIYQENYTNGLNYTVTESGYYQITNQVNVSNAANLDLGISIAGIGVCSYRTVGIRYERANIYLYLNAGNTVRGSCSDANIECQLMIRKIT